MVAEKNDMVIVGWQLLLVAHLSSNESASDRELFFLSVVGVKRTFGMPSWRRACNCGFREWVRRRIFAEPLRIIV